MTWFLHMLSDFPTEKMIQFLFKTSEPNRCYKGKEPAFPSVDNIQSVVEDERGKTLEVSIAKMGF